MTKKPKPPVALPDHPHPPPLSPTPPPSAAASLRKIREEALGRQAEHHRSTAEVIAELEAWAAEINATIAFLRAQNK